MNQTEQIALLLRNPRSLSDEQVISLIADSESIRMTLYGLWRHFPESVESEQRRRKKREEMAPLPTDDLCRMRESIMDRRSAALAADPNDTELPDSFFEMPAVDSAEGIVAELLAERQTV